MSVGGLALPNDLSAALVHYDKELDGTLMVDLASSVMVRCEMDRWSLLKH